MLNLYSTCFVIFECLFHLILNSVTYFDFTGPDVLWFILCFGLLVRIYLVLH